jgi:tRNA 2-selenouridine synthase
MIESLNVSDFVELIGDLPVVDVRTESEYQKGHIPTALSLPLFNDAERSEIGLVYKQMGRPKATKVGLEMVGPRLNALIDQFKDQVESGRVLLHCWRGGMRSESVAWLINLTGEFEPATLRGGYKAYRNFALREFAAERRLSIVGGMTGTAKTRLLERLGQRGMQSVDLEALASHRGSAFGSIGQPDAPTQQQFENELAFELSGTDPIRTLWLEDESRHIGRRIIPNELWIRMRSAPVIVIERSREERVEHLVSEYGDAEPEDLLESIQKIEKRLGGQRTQEACDAVRAGDLELACHVLLDYYDRGYRYGLSKRDPSSITRLDARGLTDDEIVDRMVDIASG